MILLLQIYYKLNKVHYTSEICIETPQNTAKMYIKRVYFFGWRPRIWWSPPFKPDFHAISKMVQHLWSTFNFDTFLVFSQGEILTHLTVCYRLNFQNFQKRKSFVFKTIIWFVDIDGIRPSFTHFSFAWCRVFEKISCWFHNFIFIIFTLKMKNQSYIQCFKSSLSYPLQVHWVKNLKIVVQVFGAIILPFLAKYGPNEQSTIAVCWISLV